ncbi:conserved hypothetical protein [Rhodospirillum centenum SW]|uniref:Uncharacterized protein n=1 Tax=Rhodospirillum centenum (strain ATCC 51521 / SW) TaxID=414684 RepID=B6IV92_RHOCS|nr:conserved hypothetical protein [Rhodospirillum centenum SW]
MPEGDAAVAAVLQHQALRPGEGGDRRHGRAAGHHPAGGIDDGQHRAVDGRRGGRHPVQRQGAAGEAVLAVEMLHHLLEQAGGHGEFVQGPAPHPAVAAPRLGVAPALQPVRQHGPEKAVRCGRQRSVGQQRSRRVAIGCGDARRTGAGGDQRRQRPRLRPEAQGGLQQHQPAHPAGARRGEDGRQRPAQGVAGQHGPRPAAVRFHRRHGAVQQASRMLRQPAGRGSRRLLQPFHQIGGEARPGQSAHGADAGFQVPDVVALDRRRHDQHGRFPVAAIGAQAEARFRQDDPARGRLRSQPQAVQQVSLAAAHLVEKVEQGWLSSRNSRGHGASPGPGLSSGTGPGKRGSPTDPMGKDGRALPAAAPAD